MVEDEKETENPQSSQPDDVGNGGFGAEVAFRGDTDRLARLLVDDFEESGNWFPSELGAIRMHQLGAPLEPELVVPDQNRSESTSAASQNSPQRTFRDVLFSEAASVEALRRIKDYAKAHLKDSCFPAEVARVLFYACVLAARRGRGERITSLTDSQCLAGVDWVLNRDWIDPQLLDWFRSSREFLRDAD